MSNASEWSRTVEVEIPVRAVVEDVLGGYVGPEPCDEPTAFGSRCARQSALPMDCSRYCLAKCHNWIVPLLSSLPYGPTRFEAERTLARSVPIVTESGRRHKRLRGMVDQVVLDDVEAVPFRVDVTVSDGTRAWQYESYAFSRSRGLPWTQQPWNTFTFSSRKKQTDPAFATFRELTRDICAKLRRIEDMPSKEHAQVQVSVLTEVTGVGPGEQKTFWAPSDRVVGIALPLAAGQAGNEQFWPTWQYAGFNYSPRIQMTATIFL